MSDQDQPQSPVRESTQKERVPEQRSESNRSGGRHGGGGRRRQQQQQQPRQQNQRERTADSINMGELRELVELFTANGLTDFELENETIRVRLSRNPEPRTGASLSAAHAVSPPPPPATTSVAQSTQPGNVTTSSASAGERASAEEPVEDLHIITSPIVGTFYRAPSPNAEPFVRAGSHIEPDTTVCIIEAMKLMNEIQSETSGTVEKIYVENGQPVEYGQPLFGIKK